LLPPLLPPEEGAAARRRCMGVFDERIVLPFFVLFVSCLFRQMNNYTVALAKLN